MKKEIYGKKIGMTQIFGENGKAIAVTAIEVFPCIVVSKKTIDKDGYNALVISFGEIKERKVNKPMKGIFTKANVPVQKYLREIKVDNLDEYEVGKVIDVNIFENGDRVDIQGISKGKGFQGVIKRHGYSRGPQSHGSKHHRRPGSMGATTTPGRVFKGKKLPGRMGNKTVSILNLDIVKVDADKSVVLVKGSVPGAKKAILRLKASTR